MRLVRKLAFAALGIALASTAARADFIDGGFEDPAPPAGGTLAYGPGATFGGVSGTAWTVTGPGTVTTGSTTFSGSNDTFQAHTGAAWMDLTGFGDDGTPNSITQTVGTTIGQAYTLGFWIGHYAGGTYNPDAPSIIGLSINGGAMVDFVNGTNVQSAGGVNNWSFYSTTFTATTSATSFKFQNDQPIASRVSGLDDISLAPTTIVVATPGPIAGAGIPALLAMGGMMWARRRTAA